MKEKNNKIKNKKKKSIFSVIFIIIVIILGLSLNGVIKVNNIWTVLNNPYVLLCVIMLLYKIYTIIYKNVRNKYHEIDANTDLITLNRELTTEYNPSVIGYLLKQRVNLNDLAADIMNLFAMKLIDIKKSETGKYEIELKNKNFENANISQSDKYILNNLSSESSKFDFEIWEKCVKKDYKIKEFSEEKKVKSGKKLVKNILLIVLIGTIFSTIYLKVFNNEFAKDNYMCVLGGFMTSVGIALTYTFFNLTKIDSTSDEDMYLSKKGEEELKKWLKFKKFITDYTLLSERKVEEIAIYEKYIPYAVALRC